MRKKKIIALACSIGLVLVMVLTANATFAQADRPWDCLNPKTGAQRVLFTGTLDDAQDFYQQTQLSTKLGNVQVAQYTDGLPIIIPTEQAVIEILTGTSHSPDEVMATYTKSSSREDSPAAPSNLGQGTVAG